MLIRKEHFWNQDFWVKCRYDAVLFGTLCLHNVCMPYVIGAITCI
jgi:hypothetical protein